jgi:hypothetical protein
MSGNEIKQKLSKKTETNLCDDNNKSIDVYIEPDNTSYTDVEMSGNKIKQKLSNKFCCEFCDYNTDRKSNFDNHLLSLRHHNASFGNKLKQIKQIKQIKQKNIFECEFCCKIYQSNSGLWKHKQHCTINNINNNNNNDNISTAEILNIIKTLIKDNQDFTKDLVNTVVSNQSSNITNTTNNNNNNTNNNVNNNSHNKTFNLQVLLNETCKNAMNLTDFIDSIKLQLSDLIKIGEIGYVEGISNIITSNLQSLDVTERPIHCTDKKREIVYVKDEDKWEKDDGNNKIRKLIKKVSYKNENLLPQYKEKHPGCNYSESKYADQYSKIVIEAMSGDKEKDDKIIKNISKVITIDKENY